MIIYKNTAFGNRFFHTGCKRFFLPILMLLCYSLCVGLPESFPLMKNVILENVKTAENMLIAYERVMTGVSNTLELIAYSHGEHGSKEFQHNKLRYTSRK